MTAACTSHVRVVVPPSADHVALCRNLLAGVAAAAGLDGDALSDLRIAVSECVTNAVVHGSRATSTPVEVVFEAFPGRVVVEIADAGPGFAPGAAVAGSPLIDLDADLPEHGLGLPLVRALADELEIGTRPDGAGCIVRLVKHAQAA